jgi:hypothetical protein
MRTNVIPVGEGRGILINELFFGLMGVPGASELELTFDGRSIRLAPVDQPSLSARPMDLPSSASSLDAAKCTDPKESIRVLRIAQELGFTQDHFQRIHHFGAKASIQAHITHCTATSRFTSQTNVIVCRRLTRSIELRKQGAPWDDAINLAISEYPMTKLGAAGTGIARARAVALIENTGHSVREQVGWTHAVPQGGESPRSRRIFAFTGDPVRDVQLRGYPAPPHPAFVQHGGVLRLRPLEHAADDVEAALIAALQQLGDPRA